MGFSFAEDENATLPCAAKSTHRIKKRVSFETGNSIFLEACVLVQNFGKHRA
jgi:hypothetical protein